MHTVSLYYTQILDAYILLTLPVDIVEYAPRVNECLSLRDPPLMKWFWLCLVMSILVHTVGMHAQTILGLV